MTSLLTLSLTLHLNYCRKEPSIHLMGRPKPDTMFISHFSMLDKQIHFMGTGVTQLKIFLLKNLA